MICTVMHHLRDDNEVVAMFAGEVVFARDTPPLTCDSVNETCLAIFGSTPVGNAMHLARSHNPNIDTSVHGSWSTVIGYVHSNSCETSHRSVIYDTSYGSATYDASAIANGSVTNNGSDTTNSCTPGNRSGWADNGGTADGAIAGYINGVPTITGTAAISLFAADPSCSDVANRIFEVLLGAGDCGHSATTGGGCNAQAGTEQERAEQWSVAETASRAQAGTAMSPGLGMVCLRRSMLVTVPTPT
jgi:hypothetical protein